VSSSGERARQRPFESSDPAQQLDLLSFELLVGEYSGLPQLAEFASCSYMSGFGSPADVAGEGCVGVGAGISVSRARTASVMALPSAFETLLISALLPDAKTVILPSIIPVDHCTELILFNGKSSDVFESCRP
jgi:hypothetical protein